MSIFRKFQTASNDFPFGQIENAKPGRKTATLKSVRVSGEIRGLLFTYSIRQEYRNETKQALEVIYTFPVAWHTSLLGMTATIGGKELAARVIEKNEAESQYEEALSGGDSAIMVQKSAKGLYTANLGNIKAGESVSTNTLDALCKILRCDLKDILEFLPEDEN